ncbi:MAG TPA: hypothetical protein VNA28_14485 [Solirubrobacteraceae bacterium]|nr:hypothetical protein [Solirubrobacteraceae bacterium]
MSEPRADHLHFRPTSPPLLQEPRGRVSVRYTLPAALTAAPLEMDRMLMQTPYETVLVGSGARHWDITLGWDADEIAIEVRDQHDDRTRPLKGRWSAPTEE